MFSRSSMDVYNRIFRLSKLKGNKYKLMLWLFVFDIIWSFVDVWCLLLHSINTSSYSTMGPPERLPLLLATDIFLEFSILLVVNFSYKSKSPQILSCCSFILHTRPLSLQSAFPHTFSYSFFQRISQTTNPNT